MLQQTLLDNNLKISNLLIGRHSPVVARVTRLRHGVSHHTIEENLGIFISDNLNAKVILTVKHTDMISAMEEQEVG